MLLIDPDSRLYYRKIIGRDDFIRLELLDDTNNNETYHYNDDCKKSDGECSDPDH